MPKPLRLAVLISGSGTTLQNFLDRQTAGTLPIQTVLVVSSTPKAFGLERAKKAGVPAFVVSRKEAGSTEQFSKLIFDACRAARADLVCMAGFLQLIHVPEDFAGRVMNIHPSLIPAFSGHGYYGEKVHQSAIDMGVKISGCTVHFADNHYDQGPIILQRTVPVLDDDTAATLAHRVFEQECEAYPEAIRLFAEGKLEIDGRKVRVRMKK